MLGQTDVLNADQGRRVAHVAQAPGQVLFLGRELPVEGVVRQTQDAGGVRIATGVQGRAVRAALRRGAEAARQANPRGRQGV
jgi:hypothetical protein